MLGTGSAMHPYFPWYGRSAGDTAMLATVKVFSVSTPGGVPDTLWNPASVDPTKWVLQSPQTTVEIYRGPARIQPNQAWRARKNPVPGGILTEHAVLVSLAMNGNLLTGHVGEIPNVAVGDWVHCTAVPTLNGQPADDFATRLNYVVRNISASSNVWEKTLLCDITPNAATL